MISMERHKDLWNNMISHKGYVEHDRWFYSLYVQDTFGIIILQCTVNLPNKVTISQY